MEKKKNTLSLSVCTILFTVQLPLQSDKVSSFFFVFSDKVEAF